MHSHYARFSFNRPKIVRTFLLDLAMAHQNFLDKIFLSFLKRKVEKSYNFAYFVAKHLGNKQRKRNSTFLPTSTLLAESSVSVIEGPITEILHNVFYWCNTTFRGHLKRNWYAK